MIRFVIGFASLVFLLAACSAAPFAGSLPPPAPSLTQAARGATPLATATDTGSPSPLPEITARESNTATSVPTETLTPAINSTLTPTPATLLPKAATLTPTRSATSQGANCGQVVMLGPNPPRDPAAQVAENCFLKAFQECRAASLTVRLQGVDAGSVTTLIVQPPCAVVAQVETYMIPNKRETKTFPCQGLIQNRDGGLLVQGCGAAGDITVPPPATP